MILDGRTATPEQIARVARELPGATAATLVNAFPVLQPEGAYVPGGMRNGAKRYTDALQRRGLARPDPDDIWWGFLTMAGMLVRDHLMHTELKEHRQLLRAYRQYVSACPTCNPNGVGRVTPTQLDTHVSSG
jgi:hypothetical protein